MSRLTTLRRICLRRLTLPAAPLALAVAFLAFGCSDARVADESTADMESAASDG